MIELLTPEQTLGFVIGLILVLAAMGSVVGPNRHARFWPCVSCGARGNRHHKDCPWRKKDDE